MYHFGRARPFQRMRVGLERYIVYFCLRFDLGTSQGSFFFRSTEESEGAWIRFLCIHMVLAYSTNIFFFKL
jgi:hypothetical protein